MKVEYSFYIDTYGGVRISENDWTRVEQKAEQRLNAFTFGRCADDCDGEPWINSAKCAVCEMAEIIHADDKRGGKTSENNDGYSVSFDTSRPLSSLLYDVVKVYLGNTGLLYAGVKCCHDHKCGYYSL